MEKHWLQREEILIGRENIEKLKQAKVVVMGLGGVGGYAAEALCRAGIGNMILADKDVFDITNLNRQIFSLRENIGEKKVEAAKKRLLSINSELNIEVCDFFMDKDSLSLINWEGVIYCIDAIDTMTSKIALIKECRSRNIPIISCMGTGFRMDPTKLRIADIYETSVCPMAKIMRNLMRKEGISSCPVLYSFENPIKPMKTGMENGNVMKSEKRAVIGSFSFVPAAAGFAMAAFVVKSLIGFE